MATNFTEKTVSYVSTENGNYSIKSLHTHATKEDWEQPPLKSYIPEEGEIVVYDKASEDGRDLIKIGDGKTLVNELQFSGSQVSSVNGKSGIVELSAQEVGARPDTWTPTASQVGAVPTSRKVNNKALSSNISLSASDVGAAPSSHVTDKNNPHGVTAEQVGALDAPRTVSGEVVSVNDSGDASLLGLKLYGNTTQNGTPTPENPVPLESVGESGAVSVSVAGKNLFDDVAWFKKYNGILQDDGSWFNVYADTACFTNTARKSGSMYLTVIAKSVASDSVKMYLQAYYTDGSRDNSIRIDGTNGFETVTAKTNPDKTVDYIKWTFGHRGDWWIKGVSISFVDNEYEPYKPIQTITVSTEGGLHGIGDIKDEIDFARGVRVQRTAYVDLGTLTWTYHSQHGVFAGVLPYMSDSIWAKGLCTHYPVVSKYYHKLADKEMVIRDSGFSNTNYAIIRDSSYTDANAFKAAMSGVTLIYELAEPMETPLSAEELAQYSALHSHKPNTTAFNDANADMEIRYCTPNAAVPMNVGSGASGKVLGVDEHGCVTAKTLKQIGAAPAEYGLGDANNTQVITDWGALNAAVQPGWYKVTFDTWYTGECIMRVDATDNQVVQTFMQSNGELKIGRRVKVANNDWGELEDYSASAFAPAVHTHTAFDVGARPNTWLPTIADIGAAPAGYGLGTNAIELDADDDLNTVTKSGWYEFYFSTPPINTPQEWEDYANHNRWAGTIIRVDNYYGASCMQTFYSSSDSEGVSGICAQRSINSVNNPSPLEWVNPPMITGVEYRTTERYNGKPVYTRLISAGAITDSGSITITIPGLISGIRYAGRVGSCPVPVLSTTQIYADTYENGATIGWVCGHSGWIGRTVECQLWYIKG